MFKTYLEPLPYGQVGHTARVAFALPGNNGHQLAHSGSGRCCQYGHRLLAVGLGLADTPKANHGLVHLYSQFLFCLMALFLRPLRFQLYVQSLLLGLDDVLTLSYD